MIKKNKRIGLLVFFGVSFIVSGLLVGAMIVNNNSSVFQLETGNKKAAIQQSSQLPVVDTFVRGIFGAPEKKGVVAGTETSLDGGISSFSMAVTGICGDGVVQEELGEECDISPEECTTSGGHPGTRECYMGESDPEQSDIYTTCTLIGTCAITKPTVYFQNSYVTGEESNTSFDIPVKLSGSYNQPVTVHYAVTSSTATDEGDDFTLADGILTIPSGDTTGLIPVTVVNDAIDETDEWFRVTLTNPTNATLGTVLIYQYRIIDDDSSIVQFENTEGSGEESVSIVDINVVLSVASENDVMVKYSITGGSASSGSTDYNLSSTLTIPSGSTSKSIKMNVRDDLKDENDETVVLTLFDPTNASLGTQSEFTYIILDDDGPVNFKTTPVITEGASFFSYAQNLRGGFDVSVGDVLKDSRKDVIVAAGAGMGPHIMVFNEGGVLQSQFFAYDSGLRYGVVSAACDIDGDGTDEIVTGQKKGGWPLVKVFDGYGNIINDGFYVLDGKFTGGINLACGDTDGDGIAEIVVGAGPGGGPHVLVYSGEGRILTNFMAYDTNFRGGVNIATLDMDGDGRDEIVTAPELGAPHVQIFQIRTNEIKRLSPGFFAFSTGYRGGVDVGGVDIDGDDIKELIVTVGIDAQPHVKIFNIQEELIQQFLAFSPNFTGGVHVDGGDVDADGIGEIVVVPRSKGGPQVRIIEPEDFLF